MILNSEQKDNPQNMTAKDMFKEEFIQVFSKKTGNYLGIVKEGAEINFEELEAPEKIKEKENENQLKLF